MGKKNAANTSKKKSAPKPATTPDAATPETATNAAPTAASPQTPPSAEGGPTQAKPKGRKHKSGVLIVGDDDASSAEAPPSAKKEKKAKTTKEPKPKKLSALDAAAQVLKGAGKPMNALEMVEAMATQNLWSSPNGKTPSATLFAAIIREVAAKGAEARFKKVERGLFQAAGK